MPDDSLQIEIEGLDKLLKAFEKFPKKVARNMSQAGHQAGNELLDTEGLRNYPPETAANMPPTPYYIRGRGTQYASRNAADSERLGSQWSIKRRGYSTHIGNRASYAKWVHGQQQARAMSRIGWKQLRKTAKEKIKDITKTYQKWVNKTLRELGI